MVTKPCPLPHPIARAVQPTKAAHNAMPDWQSGKTYQNCSRRCQSAFQGAHARSCGEQYPIARMVKPVRVAREAESRFVSQHMLAQIVPTAHAGSVCRAQHLLRRAIPDCGKEEPASPARAFSSHYPILMSQ